MNRMSGRKSGWEERTSNGNGMENGKKESEASKHETSTRVWCVLELVLELELELEFEFEFKFEVEVEVEFA